MNNSSKIAIIGSGISGLSCAYFLNQQYDIKLYEKNNYIGGHSNTVDIEINNKKIAVDTGFIVFNHKTYPNLKAFFELLKVDYEKSQMSFAVKIIDKNLEYAGTNLNAIFAQRKNICNYKFIKMLMDIIHFNKSATKLINSEFIDKNISLTKFLDSLKIGEYFRNYYLYPMASAIWSTSLDRIGNYPAFSFIRFFYNHGLLTVSDQPQWYTVSSGSRQYVNKICENFSNKISKNDEVKQIYRENDKWIVVSNKSIEKFDKVILATHANQAIQIIQNPTAQQNKILGSFSYQKNIATLHGDESIMPINKKAWASWVYSSNDNENKPKLSVSYWMNNLQNIDKNIPLFVTLNSNQTLDKNKIYKEFEYQHPVFDDNAIKAQNEIESIQAIDELYYCGAYQSYGFHEDGISSAIRVLNKMKIQVPWQ